jgi:zinc/manganese transport system substrate-binding protein
MKKVILTILLSFLTIFVYAAPNEINIVSAENFYGSIASQIGGKYVRVTSILNNPNSDPHLFSTSASINIAISKAQVIIYNGADYDVWMDNLLNSQSNNNKLAIINVSQLMGVKTGKNPHIWYNPETFPTVAKYLTKKLSNIEHDPQATKYFNANLQKFLNENSKVQNLIKNIKQKYSNTPVTATEPVFGYMASELGLDMKGLDLQWKIMNDTEPTPKMLGAYEGLLNNKKIKILFYNNQVTDPTAKNILNLAEKNHIPIVGVSETMPKQENVNQWMLSELSKTKSALESTSR